MSVSQFIDQFIADNGGNTRDALNVALARLENATRIIVEPQPQPNAIEALSEALRRIYAMQPSGDYTASKWDAYKAVLAYQHELTDACFDRIEAGVDEWEEMKREAEAEAESDALDFVSFLKQCRP